MAVPRSDRILSVCLLAAFLGSGMPCWAQRESEFLGVKSWQGNLKVKANTLGTRSAEGSTDAWDFQWSADFKIKLDEFIPFGQFWRGKFVGGSAAVRHKNVLTNGNCTWTNTVVGEGLPANPEFFLFVGPGNNYRLQVLDGSIPTRYTVTSVCDGRTSVLTNDRPDAWFPANLGRNDRFPLPATGFDLIGGGKYPMGAPLFLVTFGFSPPSFPADLSWDFHGLASPLEVVIEPQSYDRWRPESGTDEATPGNDISVKATLQHEDGSPPSAFEKAQKFEFQLANVSKEPGIVMNFPPAGKAKNTPDLQFDKARNDRLPIILTGTDQAESIGLPHETATAIVSAYDWGAWGEIKVTAVTLDGRRIVGYLKGEKGQTSVRLPKRAADSFIADAWKSAQGVSGKDIDDDDDDPEGDKNKGDGLTLYEEYRGFYENGARIEGNPKKKDFFVRNRIGADAETGIWIFTDATGLEVHKDLQNDELGDDRLINFNHDRGPRLVDQHGVILKTDPGMDGAQAWDSKGLDPGPPKNTEYIRVQPRDSEFTHLTDGITNISFTLNSSGKLIAFDRAVAHEMAHTASVWHHGEEDYQGPSLYVYMPGYPGLPANSAPFIVPGGTIVDNGPMHDVTGALVDKVTVLRENGEDFAAYLYAEDLRMQALYGYTPSQKYAVSGAFTTIGVKGGQHSGNEQCMMRYHFARFYEMESQTDAYYYVDDGSEPIGLELCANPKGTGVNAEGRKPQPRYFDAHDKRGDCIHQIMVNDAVTPPSRSIPRVQR